MMTRPCVRCKNKASPLQTNTLPSLAVAAIFYDALVEFSVAVAGSRAVLYLLEEKKATMLLLLLESVVAAALLLLILLLLLLMPPLLHVAAAVTSIAASAALAVVVVGDVDVAVALVADDVVDVGDAFAACIGRLLQTARDVFADVDVVDRAYFHVGFVVAADASVRHST